MGLPNSIFDSSIRHHESIKDALMGIVAKLEHITDQ
jgi:hypothetical protein